VNSSQLKRSEFMRRGEIDLTRLVDSCLYALLAQGVPVCQLPRSIALGVTDSLFGNASREHYWDLYAHVLVTVFARLEVFEEQKRIAC
jgi:hypothetical protein